jgi:serine/threonine protein kinase
MFISSSPGSDMRLIDFGSGTDTVLQGDHTTFAGSAFYISPELYQRTYGQKTDVWSAGVCLYVLVSGYPADKLQKAFNMLQSNNRNLRQLPNIPNDLPDSFYDMLEGLLVYKHKLRKTAGELLQHEFVQFHKSAFSVENILLEAANAPIVDGSKSRTHSVAIRGSVGRHTLFLDFQKFERSLTTLLATLLTKKDLQIFVDKVHERVEKERSESNDAETKEEQSIPLDGLVDKKTLDIIKINLLKDILQEIGNEQV